MSHHTERTSTEISGWHVGVSSIDAVNKLPGGLVEFTVHWHIKTPKGAVDIADSEPLVFKPGDDGMGFKDKHFSRLCKLLNCAELPGLPICNVMDVVKLRGVTAEVLVVEDRVIDVREPSKK